ncbi:MAG: RnfABCDGE type electron transport complex subunit B [Candidatus Omnitrophota bacterium]
MAILIPTIVLGGLGLIFGLWLAFALKIFHVETDPRAEQILKILPGANCGACGFAGCQGFAEALIRGKTELSCCALCGNEMRERLGTILGVEATQKIKRLATLKCGGGTRCADKYDYSGPETCMAAEMLLGGNKACHYACLGFGDCKLVCPFNAITMGEDRLPSINPEKCTACGKCVTACPKKVLVLTLFDKLYHIKCSSRDKGAKVMKICKVGCIACGKCATTCPTKAIVIKDNLAVIDYEKCINCGACFKVCPTHAIEQGRQNERRDN